MIPTETPETSDAPKQPEPRLRTGDRVRLTKEWTRYHRMGDSVLPPGTLGYVQEPGDPTADTGERPFVKLDGYSPGHIGVEDLELVQP